MRTPELADDGDVSRSRIERRIQEGYIDNYVKLNGPEDIKGQASLDLYYMDTSGDAERFPAYIANMKKVVSCLEASRTAQVAKGAGAAAPVSAPTAPATTPAPVSASLAYNASTSSSQPADETVRAFQACNDDRSTAAVIIEACSAIMRRPDLEASDRVALLVRRGWAYGTLNRFQEALSDYSAAIDIGPVQVLFLTQRAIVFEKLKQYPAAIADMNRAIAMEPKAIYFSARASLKVEAQDYQGAISDYTESIRINPDRSDTKLAYAWRAMAYEKINDYASAAADLDNSLRLDPNNAAVNGARGVYYYKERNYVAARQHMDQAVRLDPYDSRALYWRAKISTAEKQDARALADLDAAVRIKPDDAEVRALRADVNYRLKNFDNAISDYGAVLSSKPDHVPAYRWRARAFWEAKDAARARADIDYAIMLAPGEAVLYADRARFRSISDKPGALLDYDKALQLDPNNAGYLNSRCWMRATQGLQLDLALADCDASIRIEDVASARNSRALVRLQRGEFQLAVDDYAESLRTAPKLASSLYGRGLALLRLGQAAAGQADLAAALALNAEIAKSYAAYGLTP
jgi:tetratricopeptide (TPR) repeat protein